MPSFTSGGVEIAYDDIPAGDPAQAPVVLIHGFASNRAEGWKRTGWYDAFARRGRRVVGLDLRGHGLSGKPHGTEDYGRARMAADVTALLDHLQVGRANLFGYSMGAQTALAAALADPDRVANLILGGIGGRLLEPPTGDGEAMSKAMLAPDPESISDPLMRSFRHFADEQGEDREALAAVTRAPREGWNAADLAAFPASVLVVAGARDHLAGDPQQLAEAFPYGRSVTVPGCDHFSAIPHALTKAAVFDFLDGLLDEDLDGF